MRSGFPAQDRGVSRHRVHTRLRDEESERRSSQRPLHTLRLAWRLFASVRDSRPKRIFLTPDIDKVAKQWPDPILYDRKRGGAQSDDRWILAKRCFRRVEVKRLSR